MLRFRLWLGIFVWWLVLFYSIERINQPIDIAGFVYILAPFVAGVVVLGSRLFRKPWAAGLLVALTLAAYLLLKYLRGYPLFGSYLPITVTEVVSLLITLLIVSQVARGLNEFEDTIVKVTFRQIGLPPRLYETVDTEDMYRELKRSRRFQHPLSMILIHPDYEAEDFDINKVLLELQRTMVHRFVQVQVAKLLSEELRDSDLVARQDGGFAVLLPETTLDDASKIAYHLLTRAKAKMNVSLKFGLAGFPDTAVTLGGLLDAAGDDMAARDAKYKSKTREINREGVSPSPQGESGG
ncbi:MAG: hypothetical protein Kow00124_24660 [Anaerolineae bacterium]